MANSFTRAAVLVPELRADPGGSRLGSEARAGRSEDPTADSLTFSQPWSLGNWGRGAREWGERHRTCPISQRKLLAHKASVFYVCLLLMNLSSECLLCVRHWRGGRLADKTEKKNIPALMECRKGTMRR